MEEISINPLKFGTEEDFRRSLTELRYLEKIHGRLKRDDLHRIAQKYQFPPEFLKEGLKGLSFPDDYMISKSKWFPILYRWRVHEENSVRKLMLLITSYIRASFSSIVLGLFIAIITLQIALHMYLVVGQTPLQILSWLILPVALLILELSWEFHVRLGERRKSLDEHIEIMRREQMGRSVDPTINFVNKHYKLVLFAGHILASKPQISFFYMGAAKSPKLKETKIGMSQRILIALHLLPQPKNVRTETETIPIFYLENPHLDYVKRLSNFFGLERTTEGTQ